MTDKEKYNISIESYGETLTYFMEQWLESKHKPDLRQHYERMLLILHKSKPGVKVKIQWPKLLRS